MEKLAKLRFEIVDVFGAFINERATVTLDCQDLTHKLRADADASNGFVIPNLIGPPNNLYRVEIDVPGYRSSGFFASAQETDTPQTRVVFMAVDPKKVIRVEFPKFASLGDEVRSLLNRSDSVLDFQNKTGEELYSAVDDFRRAGILNIVAKCRRTRLKNGRTVLSYFKEDICTLREVRRDRFFCVVPKELREETKNSVAEDGFEKASELLHRPPDGFEKAESFKTRDRAGNLQLSFFARGDTFVADVDIDDASGFAHIFQLLQNIGGSTHPYNIHQILIRSQEIDPGYRFFLR